MAGGAAGPWWCIFIAKMGVGQVAACAMIGIVALTAMLVGLDGNVAYVAIVGIAGIAGYSLREEAKNGG